MTPINVCHICQKPLNKGDKIFATLEGKITGPKKIFDPPNFKDSNTSPLIVCEECGNELGSAVETLIRYKNQFKDEE